MPIKKGLKSLAGTTPNFSNQNIENAINQLKIGWVAKTSTLDTAITTNNVLTDTQKNDARLTINNMPHLNIGRVGDPTCTAVAQGSPNVFANGSGGGGGYGGPAATSRTAESKAAGL